MLSYSGWGHGVQRHLQQYFSYSVVEKTTDLLQVTDKCYYIVLYRSQLVGIRTHNDEFLHIFFTSRPLEILFFFVNEQSLFGKKNGSVLYEI